MKRGRRADKITGWPLAWEFAGETGVADLGKEGCLDGMKRSSGAHRRAMRRQKKGVRRPRETPVTRV
jgi:hypothetical protein